MKIIHHPKLLEAMSKEIEMERLNLEISQEILRQRSKYVESLAKKIYAIAFIMFGIGFATGLIVVTVMKGLS